MFSHSFQKASKNPVLGKLLATLVPGNDLEEVEIMKHRFGTLENDMNNQQKKLDTVNELARKLLHVDHPNADEILQRQNTLNARWAQLRDMVDQKRAELDRAHRLETFRIDCQETISWIADKTRVLEDSGELTNDLSGVMRLQRRLSMMERDLGAIQSKLDSLKAEADSIAVEKPQQAMVIRQDIERIQHGKSLPNYSIVFVFQSGTCSIAKSANKKPNWMRPEISNDFYAIWTTSNVMFHFVALSFNQKLTKHFEQQKNH